MSKKIIVLLISVALIIIFAILGCNLLNKRKVDKLQDNKRYQECLKVRKQDCIDVNMACREEKKPEDECKKKNDKCIKKAEKVCVERIKNNEKKN